MDKVIFLVRANGRFSRWKARFAMRLPATHKLPIIYFAGWSMWFLETMTVIYRENVVCFEQYLIHPENFFSWPINTNLQGISRKEASRSTVFGRGASAWNTQNRREGASRCCEKNRVVRSANFSWKGTIDVQHPNCTGSRNRRSSPKGIK